MHYFILVLIALIIAPGVSSGQRIYSVVFNQLPKDMQMYARDDNNMAEIPVSGVIELPDWKHMSTITYRNGVRYNYQRSVLNYGGKTQASFAMKTSIKAEVADYSVEVWACKAADSVLMVKRNDIAAGDFYLISGQSNGAAIVFDNWGSKYCRTIARIPDESPGISPADTNWIQSSWSFPYAGAWGIHLQRLILEKYGIPTTIINGSMPGAKISEFAVRWEFNPADPYNLYGALLYRSKIANPKRIKGFFWFQGEQESIENISGYESSFAQLHQYWTKDFPAVEKFFVIQVNLFFTPVAPSVRDFQRRTKYLFPKTDHFSTLGVNLSDDGVHYTLDSYKEFGRRIFDFLSPQYYGKSADPQVNSPDVQKVFYSAADKKEITLVFEPGQKMEWPADSTVKGEDGANVVISNKDLFFFDNDPKQKATISKGVAEGNRIVLSLANSSGAQKLTYLPIERPANIRILRGPFIRNGRQLSTFSFADVAIAPALATPILTAAATASSVNLQWQATPEATSYLLQRKAAGESTFATLVETKSTEPLVYVDQTVKANTQYSYRISAISANSESPYSLADVIFSPVLGLEPAVSKIFSLSPNPATDKIRITFATPQTGRVSILNLLGVEIKSENIQSVTEHTQLVGDLNRGVYFLSFENDKGEKSSKKFLK